MHKNTSKKGFTLVEIMIVVVIIGLLAAMAIPAFQKVRESSRASAMDNDARQIASAAQQYMLENNTTSATISYAATSGSITGNLFSYVKQIGKGYTVSGSVTSDGTFSVGHPQANPTTRTYSAEGQKQ
ncbi:MAG: prepilin-type cleavage/methylation domain-containing protein [Gammaproteobacteria bacterium]|uniref:type IV pilin protein n=1 Tax=Candidatus Pelagisphaera phototrophica TaxID=2684113 RepID=UPI000B6A2683|nr:prepilin-type N-terminal cleavage/methylation domain-containing protein [Candidatus Pelagisphaera phototrophica]MBU26410.1 prepilin-type cleavage/methylation domain-containing protein [Gammaproteobacteria bacterium]QXD32733.1 prepilin-type N-terminal cleavage/methylation domain-containing protein [Candidatus Pelagisphaera phototrophica]|tara:strand:+ start:639 stop:1022 length:384 start_codon:yes stop_codon:yes gene_type:complete